MGKDNKWRGLSSDGRTITLQRFEGKITVPDYATEQWLATHSAQIGTAAALDVETTGLSHQKAEVIEIGIRKFHFNRETFEIVKLGDGFQAFQQPEGPITPEIEKLTGITDEMVRGKAIDWSAVADFITPCEFMVAHNARFDRPFIDSKAPISNQKLWACSYTHMDWSGKGFAVGKLEILAAYHGFFYGAHRALEDSDVVVNLLSMKDAETGVPYFRELIENAEKPYVEVLAIGAPFDSKDHLKGRGYKWDNQNRFWKKVILDEARSQEVEWLESIVYNGGFRGKMREIAPTSQFQLEG